MISSCFRRSNFLVVMVLVAIALNFAVAEDERGSNAATFKSDLALVSLPAASNDGCPANTIRFNVTGSGPATSLGTVSVSEFVCLDPVSLLFTAQFTLTAQNGDKIFATASGYGVPTSATTFDVRGTWNFKGGTGHYTHIRGNGASLGHVNLVTGESPHELIGNTSGGISSE